MLLEKGKDYDYRPGARLGDSGSIVFWHRDKDKGTYRAVYGDLSVKDLKPTDVPPPVKDTPAPPTPVRAVPPRPPTAASLEVAPPRAPAPAPARPPTRDTPELLPAQPQDR